MEKLSHTTESIIDENVERLAELFPEVVTEVREPDGSLRRTIDVEALKERVGDVAEGQRERYQFTWPGKRDAKQEAYRQIDKCLRPCPEESVNWDTTQNLYIEGDNLDALKLLRNTYAGKVKMIYIDPPYNTGHDFIYDDDFAQTKADYDAESGDYNEEGGRLVANPESNGRFHSDWCSMMYPRLLLARDLLSEDGVIFISIDDGEVGNLRKLCESIFGEHNVIANLIWQKKFARANDAKYFSTMHDHILCCCKNSIFQREDGWKIGLLPRGQEIPTGYSNPDNDPRGPWTSVSLSAKSGSDSLRYEIVTPSGRVCLPPSGRYWNTTKERYERLLADGRITFGKAGDGVPRQKTFLSEVQQGLRPNSILSFEEAGHNQEGKQECNKLFGNKSIFDGPKPVRLIHLLCQIAGMDKGATILDFFSGSATTAHAVMQLNAEDGGNRKFIMVQLPEACDEKSEAAKAGYGNICEIGKERIRRAGRKIAAEVEEQNRQPKLGEEPKRVPDIGFRVLKIDSSNFEDVSAEPAEYTQQTLAGLADNLKPGRTAEDLLFQVMPQFQIPLSAKIEKRNVNGSTVFSVDDGRLVACFDRNVATETIVAMAKSQPDYAVMRDASFTGDDAVSNFGELFKTYSSATITRVV